MKPTFEVFSKDKRRHYKIYENGIIEGFPKGMIVINRILPITHQLEAKIRELQKRIWEQSIVLQLTPPSNFTKKMANDYIKKTLKKIKRGE